MVGEERERTYCSADENIAVGFLLPQVNVISGLHDQKLEECTSSYLFVLMHHKLHSGERANTMTNR